MANFWVTKSGSDANPGTPDLPKRTITAAVTGAATNDVIYIGTGIYNEVVRYRDTPAVNLTLQASGLVIIDGQDIRSNCVVGPNAASTQIVRGIIFRNALGTIWLARGIGGAVLIAEDCEFLNAQGLKESGPTKLTRCIIRNLFHPSDAIIHNTSSTDPVELYDTLFDNCVAVSGLVRMTASSSLQPIFYRNIISRCPTLAWHLGLTVAPTSMDFNFYDHNLHFRRASSIFSSLTAWKAQSPLTDPFSVSGTPEFVDINKGLFAPLPGGNLTKVGPNESLIGPFRVALGLSANRNSTHWTSGTHVNTAFDASGNLFLVDSTLLTGSYTLATLDLGAVLRVRSIRISTLFETPTDTVDAEINDTSPFGHLTIEYRSSAISQSDAESKPFSKVRRFAAGIINFPPNLNARWVQVRLILRSDGVEV